MTRSHANLFATLAATALATAALGPCTASAQGTGAQRREARQIAVAAEQAYNTGNFEEALAQYERAYEVFPAPQLQFNLGQCHRELGNHERTVFFLERYLEELPTAPNRETVLELVAEARAAIAETERAAEEARQQAEEARQQEAARVAEAHQIEMARQQEELRRREAERFAILRRAEAESGSEVYEEWWFWTLIGAVVAAGVGITVGMVIWQTPVLPSGTLGTVDAR